MICEQTDKILHSSPSQSSWNFLF